MKQLILVTFSHSIMLVAMEFIDDNPDPYKDSFGPKTQRRPRNPYPHEGCFKSLGPAYFALYCWVGTLPWTDNTTSKIMSYHYTAIRLFTDIKATWKPWTRSLHMEVNLFLFCFVFLIVCFFIQHGTFSSLRNEGRMGAEALYWLEVKTSDIIKRFSLSVHMHSLFAFGRMEESFYGSILVTLMLTRHELAIALPRCVQELSDPEVINNRQQHGWVLHLLFSLSYFLICT